MPVIIELKSGNRFDENAYTQKQMAKLVKSRRYIYEGDQLPVSKEVAIRIIEEDRLRVIEERKQLEADIATFEQAKLEFWKLKNKK